MNNDKFDEFFKKMGNNEFTLDECKEMVKNNPETMSMLTWFSKINVAINKLIDLGFMTKEEFETLRKQEMDKLVDEMCEEFINIQAKVSELAQETGLTEMFSNSSNDLSHKG